MAKKRIPPDKQTEALSRATWEFEQRNPAAKEKLKEEGRVFRETHKETIYDIAKIDERFEKYLSEESHNEIRKTEQIRPAAYADRGLFEARMKTWLKLEDSQQTESKEFISAWKNEILKNAQNILKVLIGENLGDTLLVSVDLSRSKEAIMAEIDSIIAKKKASREDNSRLKWLPLTEQLLQVWDLYSAAGRQPVKTTFRQIAKIVGRPLSTVRDQWLIVYEKIFDEQYKPEEKYSTEEKRASADELCAKCPHATAGKTPKCYRSGDFIPCAEYLRLAGKDRIIKSVEFGENIDYESKKKDPSE